jgi:hypothetical protein
VPRASRGKQVLWWVDRVADQGDHAWWRKGYNNEAETSVSGDNGVGAGQKVGGSVKSRLVSSPESQCPAGPVLHDDRQ